MVVPLDDEMLPVHSRQQRHNRADWQLAMEALWWLGVIRLALCFLPFKHILRWMGLVQGASPSSRRGTEPDKEGKTVVFEISLRSWI